MTRIEPAGQLKTTLLPCLMLIGLGVFLLACGLINLTLLRIRL